MATQKKGRVSTDQSKSSSNTRRGRASTDSKASPTRAETGAAQTETGERDESYNLVSVLYHALQSADTMSQYIRDAQQANDEDLASFFEDVQKNEVGIAQRARVLLAARLDVEADEEEEYEEDDEGDEVASPAL